MVTKIIICALLLYAALTEYRFQKLGKGMSIIANMLNEFADFVAELNDKIKEQVERRAKNNRQT